jgi:hypothetical protein
MAWGKKTPTFGPKVVSHSFLISNFDLMVVSHPFQVLFGNCRLAAISFIAQFRGHGHQIRFQQRAEVFHCSSLKNHALRILYTRKKKKTNWKTLAWIPDTLALNVEHIVLALPNRLS